uniref:Uncharacterized protein n=1 Tax=Anguilla anguilla TaxID=7936 RepID=A0A0E9S821_ANGAN
MQTPCVFSSVNHHLRSIQIEINNCARSHAYYFEISYLSAQSRIKLLPPPM